MAKKVFVSYDHSEDVHYKDLLRAWDANTDFDFEFDLRSPNVAIDSAVASVIQATLTKKMKEADFILVIIGRKSYASNWIKWEIKRAQQDDTKLKFAAVKINSENILPSGMPIYASIINGFTLDGIIGVLSKAKNN
jgi:hypothetical protein